MQAKIEFAKKQTKASGQNDFCMYKNQNQHLDPKSIY